MKRPDLETQKTFMSTIWNTLRIWLARKQQNDIKKLAGCLIQIFSKFRKIPNMKQQTISKNSKLEKWYGYFEIFKFQQENLKSFE